MTTLVEQARSYLEAGGFRTRRREKGFLSLERSRVTGTIERQLVWCADDDAATPSSDLTPAQRVARETKEAALLRSFELEMRGTPGATGFYLVNRKLGLSQDFISSATLILGERGGIRVPVEFFDTSYAIDRPEARRARSVLGDVLARAERTTRVPQPFSTRTTSASVQVRGDVVETLYEALTAPAAKPTVHVIDGPAGSGKSIAFNALVAAMHRGFMAAKGARQEAARPIVFLPEHLRRQPVGYVDDILAAVAATDVADLTSPEQMKWLLKKGRSIWMFDGLDEFYGGDSNFLSFVEQALTGPDSRAQFVICARDSLLSSSPAVRNFVERRMATGTGLKIYELSPWTTEACEQLAWLELENSVKGRRSVRVDQFVSLLRTSKETAALAQLPFYCRALLAVFKHDSALPKNDLFVLETLVECMVDREHGKHIFRWKDFVDFEALRCVVEDEVRKSAVDVPTGKDLDALIQRILDEEGRDLLFELIAGYAHRIHRMRLSDPASSGISADLIEGNLSKGTAAPDTARQVRTALVRFAFFGAGRKAGSVDFSHAILAEYLAARYALSMLQRVMSRVDATGDVRLGLNDLAATVREAVGSLPIVPGSVFHRYFAQELGKDRQLRRALQSLHDHGDFVGHDAKEFLQLLLEGLVEESSGSTPPAPRRRFSLGALFGTTSAR